MKYKRFLIIFFLIMLAGLSSALLQGYIRSDIGTENAFMSIIFFNSSNPLDFFNGPSSCKMMIIQPNLTRINITMTLAGSGRYFLNTTQFFNQQGHYFATCQCEESGDSFVSLCDFDLGPTTLEGGYAY